MFTNQESQNPNAAEANAPAATTLLTPEAVVEALRAIRSQIAEVAPLTPEQRKHLRNDTRTPDQILQASINVIDVTNLVSTAVGTPAAEVRELFEEANRWTAAEDELRSMLSGISGANLIRRQRVAVVAKRAAAIAAQLAHDPAHSALVPHVVEISRLKSFKRRKKAAEAPATPPTPTKP